MSSIWQPWERRPIQHSPQHPMPPAPVQPRQLRLPILPAEQGENLDNNNEIVQNPAAPAIPNRRRRRDRQHNHPGECPCCEAKLRSKDRKIASLQATLKDVLPNFNKNGQQWENLTSKGRQGPFRSEIQVSHIGACVK